MTRTENEQEFVLGNRQLLSAFFVVVLLLGVFFVMGYIVGSNSKTENAAKKAAQAEPAPVAAADTPNRASAVQPDATTVPAEQTTPAAVQEEKPAPPVERKRAIRTVPVEGESEAPARGPR